MDQGARNALGLLARLDQAGDLQERPNYVSYAPLYKDLLSLAKRPNQFRATHVLGELSRIYCLRRVRGSTAWIENRDALHKACRQVLYTTLCPFMERPQIYAIYYAVLDLAESNLPLTDSKNWQAPSARIR